ncbi:MAG: GNAT family N-acetyltransferase [Eubacterium sp.]|nr:GNAT family N-acetyltransferase [Eubacterium sp.]
MFDLAMQFAAADKLVKTAEQLCGIDYSKPAHTSVVTRDQHIGSQLFKHVKQEVKQLGCYEITLNVWEGNDSAKAFYDKMQMKPKSTTMEFIL